MGRTVQIRGASRDSLVSCLTYMGSDPWANPLVIFQAISYTEKEIVYPAQVMLRQKSGTCSQQTSARSRRLFGIRHSSGGHWSVVQWSVWLPSGRERGNSWR